MATGTEQIRVQINPCTRLAASQAGYSFNVGDQLIAKGQKSGQNLSCQQGIAIPQWWLIASYIYSKSIIKNIENFIYNQYSMFLI